MKTTVIAILALCFGTTLFCQEQIDTTTDKKFFPKEHIFKYYSYEDVSKWVTDLDYCIFLRGYDGLANDGDCFLMALVFDSIPQLKHIEKAMDIAIKNSYYDKIRKGKKFESKPLGSYECSNKTWLVYLEKNRVTFSPSNCKSFYVCNDDYEACIAIEEKIKAKNLSHLVDTSIKEYENAITLDKYPLYFKTK